MQPGPNSWSPDLSGDVGRIRGARDKGRNDHFALLVVPPDTTADAAHEAMARAVRADNITQATQILIATTPEPEDGPADAAG
ncbi:hypothetical protein [Streptomyces sp. W1SF4]|uniref:hypothetical protein n=1 Tax=Streptomyces sp. W1SF4 TaxID=2305220 RepID=UPI000F6BC654|nr:hypothetical protein [Streptomyces sp. W1SF4]AZM87910.1 hypothetical protein D1J60_04940 [Streptomyces sp. W1SF4]